jgi:hypothetical protein
MKINGACYCGLINYEAEIDPQSITICHCTDCQTLSGSAFRTLGFTRDGTFRLLSGRPKTFVRTSQSGTKRRLAFCAECGTPVFSSSLAERPKTYAIRIGTIRQRDELVPKVQIWTRSSQRWLRDLESIPSIETQTDLEHEDRDR